MTDRCLVGCGPDSLDYLPYCWRQGYAFYECQAGHKWSWNWEHGQSGDAFENRGVPVR